MKKGYMSLGGNNQKVYRVTDLDSPYSGSVIKVLENEFHGESPYKDRNIDKRINASIDAYMKFPDLAPRTKKIAGNAISQDFIEGGVTLGEALKRGYSDSVNEIFCKMKKMHDKGYIHGDVTETNLQTGRKLSVDFETFGPGDKSVDLNKARLVAKEYTGGPELVNRAIERIYGDISLN